MNGPKLSVVDLTRRLIAVGARSGDEGAVADIVEEAMQELGFRDIGRDRLGSVVGYVGPRGAEVAVLFDSHMDVVAATGDWTFDPFGGEVHGGRLWGRGATDMKGALAASLCGVAAAAREGALGRAVAVSASVLEETVEGGALGEVLDAVRPTMTVICEPSALGIRTGQRGRIEILLEVRGIPAHAAHPERGRNAILLAAEAILAVAKMDLPDDSLLGPMIIVPTDIVSDPYPLVSALPDRVTVRFDRRTGLGESRDAVLRALSDRLARIDPDAFSLSVSRAPVMAYTGVEVGWDRDLAAWTQDPSQPLVLAAVESLKEAGIEARLGTYAFCTNGSESAGRRGIATIGLGPGDEGDAHVVDESVSIAQLEAAVAVYRNLAIRLAGGPG